VRLDRVEITVLDEADHMADLGFLPGVTRILAATPQGGQRMLFSATLDRGVDALVRRFLRDEVRHEVDEESVPQGEMTHRVFVVSDADKTSLVRHLASGRGRRILFTRTKHQAKKLAKQLTASGIPAVDLHGNLSQAARERNLAAFGAGVEAGGVRVLVATDVAARGVHVDDVELVVHVDPPVEHKAYLHRSGRTARAGASGTVVTVALDAQRRDVNDLLRKAQITAPLEPVSAVHPAIAALVGDPAPHVTPAPVRPSPRSARAADARARRAAPAVPAVPPDRRPRQRAASPLAPAHRVPRDRAADAGGVRAADARVRAPDAPDLGRAGTPGTASPLAIKSTYRKQPSARIRRLA
jgi:superfamily II DNA/RNA helicase